MSGVGPGFIITHFLPWIPTQMAQVKSTKKSSLHIKRRISFRKDGNYFLCRSWTQQGQRWHCIHFCIINARLSVRNKAGASRNRSTSSWSIQGPWWKLYYFANPQMKKLRKAESLLFSKNYILGQQHCGQQQVLLCANTFAWWFPWQSYSTATKGLQDRYCYTISQIVSLWLKGRVTSQACIYSYIS